MFVSLLQLMGFPSAKPVHSRAEENARSNASTAEAPPVKVQPVASQASQVQAKPARRNPVKAPVVKTKAVAHKAAQATPKPAKTSKTVAVGKPVAAKTKTAPAAVTKTPPSPKPAAKNPAKSVDQAAAKAPPVTKTTKVAALAKPVAAAKPVAVKVQPKAAAPVPSKSKMKPEEVTPKTQTETAKPAATSPQLTPLGVPVRSGRPSSRLAQLTVPSMAQSVASTAAKASFTQMTSTQPIVPPLASSVKRDPALANNWKTKSVSELTDPEIMAMSDDEYMNETQMAYFRAKLVVLKNDILSSAGETTEHLREDTAVVPDPADRATIEEEHALELRTRDRERKLLKKIEQSINRIDAGDYGYCDETGEPIGVGRLLARPTATLSLEAQQRRELKQRMFGD